jgi:hypothetical protein
MHVSIYVPLFVPLNQRMSEEENLQTTEEASPALPLPNCLCENVYM